MSAKSRSGGASTKMTLTSIQRRLVLIGHYARVGALESARFHERALHLEVLRAVAQNKAGPVQAREALRSFELEFRRHECSS